MFLNHSQQEGKLKRSLNVAINVFILQNRHVKLEHASYSTPMSKFRVRSEIKARKKNFGSGQLIFENWSGGPVKHFFLLNHNLNFLPNFSESKVLNDHKDDPV